MEMAGACPVSADTLPEETASTGQQLLHWAGTGQCMVVTDSGKADEMMWSDRGSHRWCCGLTLALIWKLYVLPGAPVGE